MHKFVCMFRLQTLTTQQTSLKVPFRQLAASEEKQENFGGKVVISGQLLLVAAKDAVARERDRERERERDRDRETEKQRNRDRETETETQTQRDRDRETERHRERETDRQTNRQTDRQTDDCLIETGIFGHLHCTPKWTPNPYILRSPAGARAQVQCTCFPKTRPKSWIGPRLPS